MRLISSIPPELMAMFIADGFTDVCFKEDQICCISQFAFTYGLMVGLSRTGYERRYCYENYSDTATALAAWDGVGHPTGPWIKCKGRYEGKPIDLLNPNFEQIEQS